MGMTVKVEIKDSDASPEIFDRVFSYFSSVDEKFSTYKEESEISKINRGEILPENYSIEMQEIFKLAEKTKKETDGYFDIWRPDGKYDPSGIVKGWAIYQASQILKEAAYRNFFIEVGGDVETASADDFEEGWKIGIRNPFKISENVKVLSLRNEGVATSGNYVRGEHIYNPKAPKEEIKDIVSLTVVAPDIYEADRFATACFAMGRDGIYFLEKSPGLEGYVIDSTGIATFTSGFEKYLK
jgi:thiamine biosynthesis lipoprotein